MLEVLRKDGRQLCVVEPNLLADREALMQLPVKYGGHMLEIA